MPCVKRSIAATLALLTVAACRANADEAPASFSWLAPADYLRWTRQVVAAWQPPMIVQDLTDIVLAKPLTLPPGEHRGPAGRTRFGWPWMKARFDKNQDDVVTRQEFVGPTEFFDRLDRNHDGLLRADDFDWSQPRFPIPQGGQAKRGPGGPGKKGARPPGSGPGQGPPLPALHVFRTMDDDDDNRISAKEWNRYFEKLAKNKGYVTLEDMRKEVADGIQASQRERTRAHRLQFLLGAKEPVDPASVDGIMLAGMLLRECLYGRPRPGGPGPGGPGPGGPRPPGPGKRPKDQKPPRNFLLGPQPGEPAPQFTLSTLDGRGKISLSDYRGRAVVLIFGSLTWPGYRSQFGDMEDLHKRYKGYTDQIVFLTVYTREAHPIEGREWHEGRRNPARGTWEFDVKQPRTLGQRCDVAKLFCNVLKPTMPVVVDNLDDKVMRAYQAVPDKFLLSMNREGWLIRAAPDFCPMRRSKR